MACNLEGWGYMQYAPPQLVSYYCSLASCVSNEGSIVCTANNYMAAVIYIDLHSPPIQCGEEEEDVM